MIPPTRQETADVIRNMLSGKITRQEASTWACKWILSENVPKDAVLWKAIKFIGAADLNIIDHPYLYDDEMYLETLKEIAEEGDEI